MSTVKQVSYKPRYQHYQWRAFEYCSKKSVPDSRCQMMETTAEEVKFSWQMEPADRVPED